MSISINLNNIDLEDLIDEVWLADIVVVANSSKNDNSLILPIMVILNTHWMIAYLAHLLRFWNVFYFDPGFLLEQEKIHVVEEWNAIPFAFIIISTSYNYNGLTQRKIFHHVTDSSTWWITSKIYSHPFNLINFLSWLIDFAIQVTNLVLELTLLRLSSKVVNTLKYIIFSWFWHILIEQACMGILFLVKNNNSALDLR